MKLTCPRRVRATTILGQPATKCKKAAIQRSAEGAGQVQRGLGRLFLALFTRSLWDCGRWFPGPFNQMLLVSLFGHQSPADSEFVYE
jgi:hypothetical protein